MFFKLVACIGQSTSLKLVFRENVVETKVVACFQILRWVGIHKTYYDGLTIILKVGVSYHQSDHYCGKVVYF
jgi:hypothetical protein